MRFGLNQLLAVLTLLTMLATACAGPAQRTDPQARADASSAQPTVLRTITRIEPENLTSKFIETGGRADTAKYFLNAPLTYVDNHLQPQGILAERLPQLNTDSWKVAPDGTMETTYRLRPGLTWHDGQPLTADDFVFAWQVYTTPSLDVFVRSPQQLMEMV